MLKLSVKEIFIRLLLSIIFSGLIGFEREKNNSSAGLKTHILVSMGATIISLIQIDTLGLVADIDPKINIRVDAVRLIAQVVSGIGFLGAGAILTTKRSIIGLTTAASIWGVSGIGLALGMGFYEISIVGTILILMVLVGFKRVLIIHGPQQVLIKFISDDNVENQINELMGKFDSKYEIIKIKTDFSDDYIIKTHFYKIHTKSNVKISDIVNSVSRINKVLNIEPTDLR
ncbi:MAG: MgtC/SapB family protein [Helcococcus sp.]|nr:MgtC/SapB family protein [Helcococcus sp.]